MDIASLPTCEFGMTCVACCSTLSVLLPDPMTSPLLPSWPSVGGSKSLVFIDLCSSILTCFPLINNLAGHCS